MRTPLNQNEISEQLKILNNHCSKAWCLSGDRITKEFRFEDFKAALDFMIRVGRHAEALDHHPEWSNVYNKVSIELTTHSAKGITNLDFSLAARIEEEFNHA